MECPICVEKYTKSARKCIVCPSCQTGACAHCLKKFLIENTIEAKCMSCNARWDMEFLRSNLTRVYMDTEYREHQINSLLAEADTRVPDYLRVVAEQKEYNRREELRWKEIGPLFHEKMLLYGKVSVLNKQKKELQKQIQELEDRIEPIQEKHRLIAEKAKKKKPDVNHETFFMACPRTDCRGRVSTGYKCGLCTHIFCADCHADKGTGATENDDHECKKEDLDTVALLKQDTKQCPKCHMGIYKTKGCDQMWCVSCHTCFSWKSGQVLNGVVHNPHYYEYMRRVNGTAPRNPGDVLCGGIPNLREVLGVARLLDPQLYAEEVNRLSNHHRMLVHIQNVSIPPVQRRVNWDDRAYFDVKGAQYLEKKLSREEWGQVLYKNKVEREQDRRLLDLFTMLTQNGTDLFRNFVGRTTNIETALKHLDTLVDYANEQLTIYNKQFHKKRHAFNPSLETYPF